MNRVDRLFGILTLLQSKSYVSGEEIAGRYEISVRTVYRDIKAIGESGVPVAFEPHRGYFIVEGYFVPPVAFTMEEANALLLSASLVSGFADASIRTHFTSALTKVKNVLKGSQKEKLETLSRAMKLQVPQRVLPDYDFLSVIQESITSRQMLWLSYTNAKDEPSLREIEPIGLVFYAFDWHVIAWCHLRAEYRDFRLSRIGKLTRTDKAFQIESHIAIGEYKLPVDY
jgi:predicted DNA-binding transcriptional regulator YafY